jgi:hypothetical protein
MPIWIQSAGYLAAYGVAGTVATLVWFLVVLQWERRSFLSQPALCRKWHMFRIEHGRESNR